MWALRQLALLLERAAVAATVAGVVAGVAALVSNHPLHTLRVALIFCGAVTVALGAMGGGSSYEREADMRASWRFASFVPAPAPGERRLAPGAVFALSGAIVIALGFAV